MECKACGYTNTEREAPIVQLRGIGMIVESRVCINCGVFFLPIKGKDYNKIIEGQDENR